MMMINLLKTLISLSIRNRKKLSGRRNVKMILRGLGIVSRRLIRLKRKQSPKRKKIKKVSNKETFQKGSKPRNGSWKANPN